MVTPTTAIRRCLFGRSPMRMRTTQFAKASGRLPFTQSLSLPTISTRAFTMRTRDGEHEVSVALPPNVPQPPDLNHCFERYSLYMRLQDGCSVEECQEVAATLEMYAARIIAGCEQKPYAHLDAGSADDTAAPARANVAVQVTLYVPPPGYPGGIEMTVYDSGSDIAKGLKSLDARIEHCTLSGEVKEAGLWYGDDDEAQPASEADQRRNERRLWGVNHRW
ncbi:hypothetical protein D0860_00993 [Hortaea werneckii]|uniref:Uncharacterized protein n=1 Tax=Hortaea werneckii TaxID=91943 RepID=A0A3M7HTK4_HORWE|nr:hypothetical protein D0860_00993 [Hortaea werneckii]